MKIDAVAGSLTDQQVDVLVVNLFSGVTEPKGATGAVDTALDGAVSKLIAAKELTGALGEVVVLRTDGRLSAGKVLVVGLGDKDAFGPAAAATAAAAAVRTAAKEKCKTMATIAHGAGIGGLDPRVAARATVEGSLLGGWRYRRLKTVGDSPDDPEGAITPVDSVVVVELSPHSIDAIRGGVDEGRIVGEAVNYARDLIITPANLLGPVEFAAEAESASAGLPISVEVFDEERLAADGLRLVLAVGAASCRPPRMIVLRYRGRDDDAIDLALVGKGLTFDSGGLQIKPGTGMGAMKGDMAGGAAVLAATVAVARLGVPVNLLTVIPAVDNMVSGHAMRPGDVFTSYSGKTVEVVETDAEGRLVLADGVAWAEAQGASAVVDVATLTGACMTALGRLVTGMFATNELWRDAIVSAGAPLGERFWELPLVKDYQPRLVSDIADLRNHDGTAGGLVLSAMFIGAFVKSVPWVHLDIAGTAGLDRPHGPYAVKGPTGVPTRTLISLAEAVGKAGGTVPSS